MAEVILIVDQYRRHKGAAERHQKIDPEREAQGLSQVTKVLGRNSQRVALVAEGDDEGFRAYQKAGFQVRSMNGNRPDEVQEFIMQTGKQLSSDPPKHLVIVTDDPVFQFLLQDRRERGTQVAVWVPGPKVPVAFSNGGCDARLLEELLPELKIARIDVRLDYENLHVGLEQRGWPAEPRQLIEAVKAAAGDLGEIVSIVAYADWDLLAQRAKRNIQRELALMGVKTRYQVNLRGKNSADMEIANDLRTLMERDANAPDAADIILIGSGDRDFRATVESAKE